MNLDKKINQVAKLLNESENILFITGAGISADSGMPTYRGVGGLYNDKKTEENIPIEEAISGGMFKKRPDITWKYLWQVGSACKEAYPNQAHKIIAEIEKQKAKTWVLTQNVDGLHRDAGTKNLIEIHGNAFSLYCISCKSEFKTETLLNNYDDKISLPPKCNVCGGIIRPAVVLFGEQLPSDAINKFYGLIDNMPDLIISIGTSSVFPYISEPIYLANNKGKPTVEINPTDTMVSDIVSYKLPLKAAEGMARIYDSMKT